MDTFRDRLTRTTSGRVWHLVTRPSLLLAVCCAATLVLLLRANDADFITFATAVRRALDGQPIYAPFQLEGPYELGQAAGGGGFVYPPSAVPLMFALTAAGGFIFRLTGLLAMVAVAFRILRRHLSPLRAAVIYMGLLATPFMRDSLKAGQADPFIAAGLGLIWLYPRGAAYFALLGGAMKIFPLAALVWVVRNRAEVMRPVAMLGALVLTTTVWLGAESWSQYLTTFLNGRPGCYPHGLPSFACVLPVGGSIVGYVIAGSLVLAAWRAKDDRTAFFVMTLGMIVPAPDLYPRYLLIPLMGAVPFLERYLDRKSGLVQEASAPEPLTDVSRAPG